MNEIADPKLYRKVRWHGWEFIIVGGAVTFPEDFANGNTSFAHIFGNKIKRYDRTIGTVDEFEDLGEVSVELHPGMIENMMLRWEFR